MLDRRGEGVGALIARPRAAFARFRHERGLVPIRTILSIRRFRKFIVRAATQSDRGKKKPNINAIPSTRKTTNLTNIASPAMTAIHFLSNSLILRPRLFRIELDLKRRRRTISSRSLGPDSEMASTATSESVAENSISYERCRRRSRTG